MTFTELVTEVMARTRQTSTEASTRIGRAINDRYRRVATSIGLTISRRGTATATMVVGTASVTFTCEKLLTVYITTTGARRVLGEMTFDEWRNAQTWAPAQGIPTRYAIASTAAGAVTIHLDPVPGTAGPIEADVVKEGVDLAGATKPDFASSFHDILLHGALSDEWMQLKQDDLSKRAEGMYEARLSDLRMFIAKSSYLTIVQGGRGQHEGGPYWPAYLLPRMWR